MDSSGITECGSLTCMSNPCQNSGICVEIDDNDKFENNTNQIQDKLRCKCPAGYMGKRCEISVCVNNPCQYGSTCVLFPGSGYLCLCPYGKHGHFCEHSTYAGNISVFYAFNVFFMLELLHAIVVKVVGQFKS